MQHPPPPPKHAEPPWLLTTLPEWCGWASYSTQQVAGLIKCRTAAAAVAALLLLLLLHSAVHQVVALPLLHQSKRHLEALQGASQLHGKQ
jgi:hypothetical protein